MRALVLHNFYRSANASGENLSVSDEIIGLRNRGWDVEVLSADSDSIDIGTLPSARLAVRPVYSRPSVKRLESAIARFRPDVALIENLFPLHSPATITALHRAGVPIAAGVRSYRMWCVRSNMFRDNHECRDCEGSLFNLPAIRNRCYQDGTIASVPMAIGLSVHRRTWQLVDRFLAVSEYVRDEVCRFGVDPSRVITRPNYVVDPGRPVEGGEGFLYAGRLTPDKGIDLLIDGWRQSKIWREPSNRLIVAGSGPLSVVVERAEPELNIEARGLVSHEEALDLTRKSAVTVIPSRWHEPFGRGVIEAAAFARPALVTDRGGLPELVVDGTTGWVASADPRSIGEKLRQAADTDAQRRFGKLARQRYETHFTETISVNILDDTLTELAEHGPVGGF